MPRQPTRPSMPAVSHPVSEDTDPGGVRHRSCGPGRAALAATEQLSRRLDDHVTESDDQSRAIRGDIREVRGEVKLINSHVGDLRVDVAKMSASVDNIQSTLADQKEMTHVRMIAEVETGKAEKIAVIEDATDRKRARRAVWIRAAIVGIGLGGTILGMLVEHYR